MTERLNKTKFSGREVGFGPVSFHQSYKVVFEYTRVVDKVPFRRRDGRSSKESSVTIIVLALPSHRRRVDSVSSRPPLLSLNSLYRGQPVPEGN